MSAPQRQFAYVGEPALRNWLLPNAGSYNGGNLRNGPAPPHSPTPVPTTEGTSATDRLLPTPHSRLPND